MSQAIINELVKLNNGRKLFDDHTFHNAATSTGDGMKLTLGQYTGQDKVIITISGTSTSRTITFKVTRNSVVGYILASKIESSGSITVAVSTTGTNEIWEIDGLAGYDEVYCSLDAVAGGNVTVTGKLVA